MVRPSIRTSICLALIIAMTGCLSGSGPSDANPTEETQEPNPGCTEIQADVDPALWVCPVSEYPPDMQAVNFDTERHNVSVSIVRDNGSVVFSETIAKYPKSTDKSRAKIFEDVIDTPGEYTIRATVDNSSTDTAQWNINEQYKGNGGIEWWMYISEGGEMILEKRQSA